MELDIKTLKALNQKSTKSKVRFKGDFKKTLEEALELLEEKVLSDI
jgi:hypothetical protein